jgi:uncharacterized repeat protein (TIGR01451 family)
MKNTVNKLTKGFVVFATLAIIFASQAQADGQYNQYGQYGGPSEAGKIVIDKLVRNPKSGEYVDNLGLSDPKYSAQSAVFFKIYVQNTGGTTLNQVNVVDYLPAYLQYVSGGSYNSTNRRIIFTVNDLAPNERRELTLQVKVVGMNEMPAQKSVLCPINKVVASSEQDGSDEDTAQLCIEKKAMVSEKVPEAGDPMGLLVGFGSLSSILGGIALKKKYS